MTMTHSRKDLQQLSDTWPYGHEWWGHDPSKKNLLYMWVPYSLGRAKVLFTLQVTVDNTRKEKTEFLISSTRLELCGILGFAEETIVERVWQARV